MLSTSVIWPSCSGDVVDADAKLVAKLHGGPADCDPLITSEIVLTDGRNPAGHLNRGEERVTHLNGVNCTDHGGGDCVYKKSGAVELGPNVDDTMFVSLVTTAGRTCVPPGFTWEVRNGDGLEAKVRR